MIFPFQRFPKKICFWNSEKITEWYRKKMSLVFWKFAFSWLRPFGAAKTEGRGLSTLMCPFFCFDECKSWKKLLKEIYFSNILFFCYFIFENKKMKLVWISFWKWNCFWIEFESKNSLHFKSEIYISFENLASS